MSCSSVAIIDPPQPSAKAVRTPAAMMCSWPLSQPTCVRCIRSTISRSMPRGSASASRHRWLRGFRCPLEELERALLLSELGQGGLGDLFGQLADGAPFGLESPFCGQPPQLGFVLDGVVATLGGHQQRVGHVAAMVRVGRRAGGNHAGQVTGRDHVGGGPTDPLGRALTKGINAARTHRAVSAAQTELPKTTLRLHRLVSIPCHRKVSVHNMVQHLDRCRINASFLGDFMGSPCNGYFPTIFRAISTARRPSSGRMDGWRPSIMQSTKCSSICMCPHTRWSPGFSENPFGFSGVFRK